MEKRAMYRYLRFVILASAVVLAPWPSAAQVLIDPHGQSSVSGPALNVALSFSEIEYDADRGVEGEVERTILGAALAFPLQSPLDMYAELGYIAEAELEGSRSDGDGVLFGGGLRGLVFRQNLLTLHARGGFRFIFEDYGSGTDGELAELELGLVGRYEVRPKLGLYGGIDLIPFSDGDLEVGNRKVDIERDDPIGLRFGAEYGFNGIVLNAELALISEEAFIFRVSFPI
jgi:hypothetical protein